MAADDLNTYLIIFMLVIVFIGVLTPLINNAETMARITYMLRGPRALQEIHSNANEIIRADIIASAKESKPPGVEQLRRRSYKYNPGRNIGKIKGWLELSSCHAIPYRPPFKRVQLLLVNKAYIDPPTSSTPILDGTGVRRHFGGAFYVPQYADKKGNPLPDNEQDAIWEKDFAAWKAWGERNFDVSLQEVRQTNTLRAGAPSIDKQRMAAGDAPQHDIITQPGVD